MAHAINALVASRADADRFAASFRCTCVELTTTLALVAMTEELADELGTGTRIAPFILLTPAALERCREHMAIFGYIETEYFGGHGFQRGAAWRREADLVEPREDSGVVNAVLRALGVIATGGRDEWDTVGLVRFRTMDDLLAK